MIKVHRINGTEMIINHSAIQQVEKTANTVITFLNGERIIVDDTPDLIRQKVAEFQSMVLKLEANAN